VIDLRPHPHSVAANDLNRRSRDIFRRLVEAYIESGEPLGSRTLSKMLAVNLSPASIRNVLVDLEEAGLIYAPHTSAGRLPTERGLRFFVDTLLQRGDLPDAEVSRTDREAINAELNQANDPFENASRVLSGLSRGAGVVVSATHTARLKHIEFVRLDADQALAVLVSEDSSVENRLVRLPRGLPAGALIEASNYLNAHILGRTLPELKSELSAHIEVISREIDDVTARVVAAGIATVIENGNSRQLIVRGQANLLDDLKHAEDFERLRRLFADFEKQTDVVDLLARAETSDGVRIFIGSENKLFSLSGSSMIAAPFHNSQHQIVGVLGVIGPTRLNYARIIPMVDYAAQRISQRLQGN
jgi:heat-inducible transcriptional repressor